MPSFTTRGVVVCIIAAFALLAKASPAPSDVGVAVNSPSHAIKRLDCELDTDKGASAVESVEGQVTHGSCNAKQ